MTPDGSVSVNYDQELYKINMVNDYSRQETEDS
jgi:hypothetical protein